MWSSCGQLTFSNYFTYDELGRLKHANKLVFAKTPAGEQSPRFDGFGNPADDSVEVEDDRLLRTETHLYRYDKYGNQDRVQSDAGYEQRQFNGLNQLVNVKTGGKCQHQC
ncbi:hypothetical protein [Photobacterium atrarenae]|uniref:Uncharacterized protein n=1 Tax=Photobacterium atrarenae TaxID=865757 RepID=A0ABY5GBA5_9GAMM|nr:hypothetical protein [Photobacterium atrarenae]UTV26466.1 hypothetical protein NNL38_08730 [Photobacterium atrarenae]